MYYFQYALVDEKSFLENPSQFRDSCLQRVLPTVEMTLIFLRAKFLHSYLDFVKVLNVLYQYQYV